ncbi:ABC transporter transmembrane domain-containing protein [Chelativorans composti]|jgi:ABC transporter, permease/ATP-binding protein|uniref:ABC transporter transmembrane domain-containing protein n=1 Tax=Chelativorans composti TaxID=768533 RepID=A0ABW5DEU1_9HYPH
MTENARGARPGNRRSLTPLRGLVPYLSRYRGLVAGAFVFLLLSSAATLVLPIAVRQMIDHGFSSDDGAAIQGYFLILILVGFVLALASAMRYFFVITLGERVVADLRRDVFDHLTRLSPSFFDGVHSGEIVSRLTADATQIKSALGATASIALRNTIMGLGALGMMVFTSPRLSLLALLSFPLVVLPIIVFGRTVRNRSRWAQDALAGAMAMAGEQIGAIRLLQAFVNEDRASRSFTEAVNAAFRAARKSITSRSILTFFAILAVFTSVVVVLWVGSQDVLSGKMTGGTLGQFLLYAVLAASSLGALSEVWGELQQAAGAAERMSELLAERPIITAPAQPRSLPSPVRGEVEFRNVTFCYPSRPDTLALRNLSFRVAPGETVAIVGPSGAGKSTIFSLLLRFYDPVSGSVLVDGVEIDRLDPKELRSSIAIVPQESVIFADTAANNIAFGRPDASRAEIEKAARAALAHDFIMALPEGYDTQLGERGVTLSGGQRQRLSIARAILRNAPILLLDEATSALDAESETLVQQALNHSMEGRTTIIIAHRLATVLKADRILVMEDGMVVEEGTHHELVRLGGVYSRLASLQFDVGPEILSGAAE